MKILLTKIIFLCYFLYNCSFAAILTVNARDFDKNYYEVEVVDTKSNKSKKWYLDGHQEINYHAISLDPIKYCLENAFYIEPGRFKDYKIFIKSRKEKLHHPIPFIIAERFYRKTLLQQNNSYIYPEKLRNLGKIIQRFTTHKDTKKGGNVFETTIDSLVNNAGGDSLIDRASLSFPNTPISLTIYLDDNNEIKINTLAIY